MAVPAGVLADVDLKDNDDRFTVVVVKAPAGTGTGTGTGTGGGTGGGNGAAGPTLPITGPAVFFVAGIGAVLAAFGALLLVITRRRRPATTRDR
jgi:hypothetical protein